MISRITGTVKQIDEYCDDITYIRVDLAGEVFPAINFNYMTGYPAVGDKVLLNTTAVDLNLGTGGYHFVMANLTSPENIEGLRQTDSGHIMKLRYTPNQIKVCSAEEQESPYHSIMKQAESLNSTPVICCALHSMLPAAAAALGSLRKDIKTVYVMTDGAALPIGISNLVRRLKEEGILSGTVTTGNSFGGDIETVNLYSGLLAAKEVLSADVIIAGMGPGIVGTGTPFGFTGIEQAEIINAVNVLEGQAVAVPRISFADPRERHRGLSHHSKNALGRACLSPSLISLPVLEKEKINLIIGHMRDTGILEMHRLALEDGSNGLGFLEQLNIKPTTMGRSISEDREFFLAASAAGIIGAKIFLGQEISIVKEGSYR